MIESSALPFAMPDLDDNRAIWSREWDWRTQGDEWSVWWGGTPAVWYGALLPRIHSFVPTGTILEIAPGYGRWTQYLKDLADSLIIVDMTERCIEHCKERFASASNIDFHVNDGRSLSMIADQSIDFVFSYDSLVHVESDVLGGYLREIATKLKPDGVGFIHHSNIGSYPRLTRLARQSPKRLLMPLIRRGLLINIAAWRAETVTADVFASQCESAGLVCVSQELVNWEHGRFLIDTFSIFAKQDSGWDRRRGQVRNPLFTNEARRMAQLYARTDL